MLPFPGHLPVPALAETAPPAAGVQAGRRPPEGLGLDAGEDGATLHRPGPQSAIATNQLPNVTQITYTDNLTSSRIRLADRHEHRMLDFLSNRLDDPERAEAPDQTALPTALTTWSTVALRCVADPTVPARDLQLISRTQTALLHAAGLLTAAALHRNELAPQSGPHLLRRLGPAAVAWKAVAEQWSWVRTPDAPQATPLTTQAAAGLSHAISAITRPAGFWASAADVADRLPGVAIAPLLRGITENSQVLADIYQHLANDLSVASRAGGRLRAPARLLLQISTENYAARQVHPHAQTSMDVLPVGMHDVTNNRLRPLTPAARERLAAPAAELAGAADRAHQAMLAATPPTSRPAQPALSAATPPPPTPHRHPVGPGPIRGPGVPR